MKHYAEKQDIQRRLGKTFSATTVPSEDDLEGLLEDADGFINKEAKVFSNIKDTYGDLRNIAIDLVLKMINNMWSFRNPEKFPYIDIELTDEQKRDIHKVHLKFYGETFDIGD